MKQLVCVKFMLFDHMSHVLPQSFSYYKCMLPNKCFVCFKPVKLGVNCVLWKNYFRSFSIYHFASTIEMNIMSPPVKPPWRCPSPAQHMMKSNIEWTTVLTLPLCQSSTKLDEVLSYSNN